MSLNPVSRLEEKLTFLTSGSRGWAKYYSDAGAKFLRIQNVGRNALMLDNLAYVNPPDSAEARRTRIQPGDVLLSITADLGRTGVVPSDIGEAYINQHLAILRLAEDCHPEYIAAFIALGPGKRQITKRDKVGVKSGINFDDVRSLKIPLPPLAEQKRIAAILDKADAIRRKRQEAIALTEEFLRSAFLDMFGDPVTNPKGWEVKPLHEVAGINSGLTKNKRLAPTDAIELPYMRVANVQDGYLNLTEIKTIPVPKQKVDQYLLQVGDVLLTEGGDPDKLGRGAVWQGQIPRCVHQNHIFSVRVDKTRLSPAFVSAQIGSERGKRYFLRAGKQTTGIASINKTQLKNFPLLIPPLSAQQQFEQVVESMRGFETTLVSTEAQTNDLFNSLVQRAFRGEL